MAYKRQTVRQGWPIAAGLLALSVIPVAAGVARLVSLATGDPVTVVNAQFFAHPLPEQLHIVGASLFCVLGALQFWPDFRRWFPRWHRMAGRMLATADIVAGLSGLWMNQFYPYGPNDGPLLYFFRSFFGAGMGLAMVLGVAAILRHDVAEHRAWMMRAYAIGLGAGTQAATQLPWILGCRFTGRVAEGPFDGRCLGPEPRRRRMVHPQAGRVLHAHLVTKPLWARVGYLAGRSAERGTTLR